MPHTFWARFYVNQVLDLSTHGEAINGEVVLLDMHLAESNHYFVGKQLNRKSCLGSIRLCRNKVS